MTTLTELEGTRWAGTGELWLDPLGDEVQRSEVTMRVEPSALRYTWQYQGKDHEGAVVLGPSGATWSDSWHQPAPVECSNVKDAWGLFGLFYTYAAGEGPPWGWRIGLSKRPSGELVLQMTNIAPWGEETRAVRMIVTRRD